MKIFLILLLATVACSAKLYINRPVYLIDILREKTLADDFNDLKALMPERKLEGLIARYLLKDAEFQAIIRYLNSEDVTRAIGAIRGQPEIKGFNSWLQQKLQTRPLDDSSDESLSDELLYQILNLAPAGQDQLRGWKGFIAELLSFFPRGEIKNLIRDKVAANGVFTEFWNKIGALRPVYERILKLTEVRTVIEKFRELGVDIEQLDRLIRENLDWTIRIIQQIEGNKLDKNTGEKLEGGKATARPLA